MLIVLTSMAASRVNAMTAGKEMVTRETVPTLTNALIPDSIIVILTLIVQITTAHFHVNATRVMSVMV